MKIGQRVETSHGGGVIYDKEYYRKTANGGEYRVGVKHDIYPSDLSVGLYKNEVVYYFPREVQTCSR